MKFNLFRRKRHERTVKQRFERAIELTIKCVVLLFSPLFIVAPCTAIWYYGIFARHFHFDEHMENIVVAAWIPMFGILYSILAATVFNTVWAEYKEMRKAVKQYDFEKFADLKDEEMSPLVYMMVGAFSVAVLVGFMSVKYPNGIYGIIVISSTSYLLSLLFIVVREIDDPCGGLWFIKSLPEEWLEIDCKKWRKLRQDQLRIKFREQLRSNGFHLTKKVEATVTREEVLVSHN